MLRLKAHTKIAEALIKWHFNYPDNTPNGLVVYVPKWLWDALSKEKVPPPQLEEVLDLPPPIERILFIDFQQVTNGITVVFRKGKPIEVVEAQPASWLLLRPLPLCARYAQKENSL